MVVYLAHLKEEIALKFMLQFYLVLFLLFVVHLFLVHLVDHRLMIVLVRNALALFPSALLHHLQIKPVFHVLLHPAHLLSLLLLFESLLECQSILMFFNLFVHVMLAAVCHAIFNSDHGLTIKHFLDAFLPLLAFVLSSLFIYFN